MHVGNVYANILQLAFYHGIQFHSEARGDFLHLLRPDFSSRLLYECRELRCKHTQPADMAADYFAI